MFGMLSYFTEVSGPLKIIIAGNPGIFLYIGMYSFVIAGIVYETFRACEVYIRTKAASLGALFFKANMVLAAVYGLATMLGNWLYGVQHQPDATTQTQVKISFVNLGLAFLMVFGAPFIMRFFLITPLEEREARSLFRAYSSKSDTKREQSRRRD